METRKRLSFLLLLKQTGCLLPITGIPCEVPVPRNVIFNCVNFETKISFIFSLRVYFDTFVTILNTIAVNGNYLKRRYENRKCAFSETESTSDKSK